MLIGALVRSFHRYLFGPIEERNTRLALNRFDIFLVGVLALALMVAISLIDGPSKYQHMPWIVSGMIIAILIFSGKRKIILGFALIIVTVRAGIGLVRPAHLLIFLIITGACGITSWLLIRDEFRRG